MKEILFNWVLPPKVAEQLQIVLAKLKNKLKYDQSLFQVNEALRDIEKGKRCFIIGTGPSIMEQDLTLLENEICIGVSGLYGHKDIAIINPKYYVLSPVFKHHAKHDKEETFVAWFKDMDVALKDDTIMFLDIGDKPYVEKHNAFPNKTIYWLQYEPWFEETISTIDLAHLEDIYSVSETAMSLALYLGFNKNYLLGFDHDWFNGLNVYFDAKWYDKNFKSAQQIKEEQGIDAEFQMRRHAKIFKKYKYLYAMKENIYNANSNLDSYVDVFPKVKYEELFDKGKGET